MSRLLVVLTATFAVSATAQTGNAPFDAADQRLKEQSYARACDLFTAYLKDHGQEPLAREATAKKAIACYRAGKGQWQAVADLADKGEKDFARAWAAYFLFEQGNRNFDQVVPLLKQVTGDSGRAGVEARRLLVRGGLIEVERNSYDFGRVNQMTELVLANTQDPTEAAHVRYLRGVARLRQGNMAEQALKELAGVGEGNTEWADDAEYRRAEYLENNRAYEKALTIYDSIVQRFSPQSSNMRSSAESRAKEIRRPWVTVSVSQVALSGLEPHVNFSFRNVKNATWSLKRADPLKAGVVNDLLDDPAAIATTITETASSWNKTLESEKYAQVNDSFPLQVKSPGVYVLEFSADGQTARDWVLVTQLAAITKTDADKVLVYVSDVETGRAQPGADVVLWARASNSGERDERFAGKTDDTGVATFPLTHSNRGMQVWARKGDQYAVSTAGSGWYPSWAKENLAYVMTDRPLYKPGEQVGFKVFTRSREGGPSQPLKDVKVNLRVSDPSGRTVAEPELTTNDFGTASFTLALPKAAQLGQWHAYVDGHSIGFQQDQAFFQVEEYKPPESTVSVEPVGNPRPGEKVKFKVKAKYFSGGALANAEGRAIVIIQGWSHSFGRWADDPLDDGSTSAPYAYDEERSYKRRPWGWGNYGQQTLVFKTAADGTAEVEADAPKAAPGMDLQYLVQVFVTDSSRREITGSGTVKVSSQAFFADLRTDHYLYRPGERVSVKLRAEDPNGRPVDADLIVRLMRLDENGGSARVSEARTKLAGGKGAVQLDADAIGMVRAEVLDGSLATPTVIAQTDLWLTNDKKPIVPPTNGFMIYTDRGQLKVGDKARVLVVGPRADAHAWLTLESDKVQYSQVVELKGRARFVELPLTATLAPNCVIFASTFSDSTFQQQQRALRVAGSAVEFPVAVDFGVPSTEPGKTVSPSVTTGGTPGAAAEAALSIVDEALFSIAPERTNFLTFFGQQPRQHAVRTSASQNTRSYMQRPKPQVTPVAQPATKPDADRKAEPADKLAEVVAPMGQAAGRAAPAPATSAAPSEERAEKKSMRAKAKDEADDSSAGPGAAEAAAPVKARTDFGSSAGWYPELKGNLGTPLAQKVKLTDSLTSWQATATVVTQGPGLGQGKGHLRTEKPLMVRLQAPRFFVEGDEVVLSAVLESNLGKPADVAVTITAPGFKALTPASATLKVTPGHTERFDARFKVVELGERTISAVARAGTASDAMEWKLPAMVHGSAQRQFFSGRLSDRFSVDFELPEKRKAALTRLELSLSPSLLSVMFDGLPYLAQYPYGCVEQTLSRFVPAVIARRAVKTLKLPEKRVPADLDDMVHSGLERLYGFQHGDGGWGWWSGDATNLWMTAYVVYALGLTRDAGLEVQAGALERGRSYLVNHLGEAQNTPETHAFMVFALSQTGEVPKQALNKAYSWRTSLSPRARAQLALALLKLNDKRARVAVENLDDIVKAASSRKDAAVGEANDAWSTSAAIEATAFTLMAYARYDLKSPLIVPLTDFLVLRRNGGKWRSTRDTAFAIYALSEVALREDASRQAGSFMVSLNGGVAKRLNYAAGGLDLTPLLYADGAFKPGKNTLEVKRDGGGTGYFAATWDVFNQNDFIKGVGGDVKVKRSYTLLGKPSADKGAAPTEYGMPVESGVRVRVDLELTANKAVEFVMVEDLKPAGFEAVQLTSGAQVCNYACAHAELRTDRVAMFLTQLPVGTTKVSYELRAEVPGKFAALPARAEAMYAPEITATADEMRFEVRDAPTGSNAARE